MAWQKDPMGRSEEEKEGGRWDKRESRRTWQAPQKQAGCLSSTGMLVLASDKDEGPHACRQSCLSPGLDAPQEDTQREGE